MSELPSAQYFELRSKNGRNQGMVVLNGQEVTSSTEEAERMLKRFMAQVCVGCTFFTNKPQKVLDSLPEDNTRCSGPSIIARRNGRRVQVYRGPDSILHMPFVSSTTSLPMTADLPTTLSIAPCSPTLIGK